MRMKEEIYRIKQVMGLLPEETKDDKKAKESGEKWINCENCKKKFTQTIHKGKKSKPICPYCGTDNDIVKK